MTAPRRLAALVVALTLSACGGGADAPAAPTGAAATYVRTTVGSSMTRSFENSAGIYTDTEIVTARSASGFTTRSTSSLGDDIGDDYQISGGALYLVTQRTYTGGLVTDQSDYAPAYLVLPGDATPGSTASRITTLSSGGTPIITYTKTATVNGLESVTVPAGTFQALKVTAVTVRSTGSTTTTVVWWAAGLGSVKSLSYAGSSATGTPIASFVLTAYSPAI